MTREEKLSVILAQLEDDSNLILLIRHMVKNTINNSPDDSVINTVYLVLNPPPEETP